MASIADPQPKPPSPDPGRSSENHPPTPAPETGGTGKGLLLILIAGAALLVAIGSAIHVRHTDAAKLEKATAESAVLSVNVVHPTAVATTEEITLPGTAQAFSDTPIYARTSGYVGSWSADIGARVKRGDVLAKIESPEVDHQLDQARADLKNAQANLNISQITSERNAALFKSKTISTQERDQSVNDEAAKRALVDSNSANVRRLEQLKAFEEVVAPFDGVITARNTDIGALIQAGDASGGKELFHLADNHVLRVYFSVPEVYAAGVKAGEQVMITFDSFPGEKFAGTVTRDSAALDPHSHTLNVEADVDNPTGRLFPGGYTAVHLKLPATAGAVTIPANTILFRAEGLRVAVVRNGRVVLAPITIGRDHGNTIEALGTLTPKDAVILDPPDSLAEGVEVRAEEQVKEEPKS